MLSSWFCILYSFVTFLTFVRFVGFWFRLGKVFLINLHYTTKLCICQIFWACVGAKLWFLVFVGFGFVVMVSGYCYVIVLWAKSENVTWNVTLGNGLTMRVGDMFLNVMLYCYKKINYKYTPVKNVCGTKYTCVDLRPCIFSTFAESQFQKKRNFVTKSGNPHKTYIVMLRFDIVKS